MHLNLKIVTIFPLFFFAVVAFPISNAGEAESECEVDWALAALESRDPVVDAHAAVRRHDLTFLGVYGYALTVPGVSGKPYCLDDAGLVRAIPDTTDGHRCKEHMRLNQLAAEYALAYNQTLLAAGQAQVPAGCAT